MYVINCVFFFKTGDFGISAVTGIIVGAFLGAAMLIIFYFFRQVYVFLSKMVVGNLVCVT